MPQLDTSTFASQIFWLLIGFGLLYSFISNVAAPKIKSLTDRRFEYTDRLDTQAHLLNFEAGKLEKESQEELQEAQDESRRREMLALQELAKKSEQFKKDIRQQNVDKLHVELEKMQKHADKTFVALSEKVDSLALHAAEVIFRK